MRGYDMLPRNLILHIFGVVTLFVSCAEFSTSFEEIASDRVRTIDFIYRNCADTLLCEAAPGDSMKVTAIFAGEKVRDIDLSVSFDVRTSLYGKTESFGTKPLDYSTGRSTLHDSGSTDADTFVFTFKIPDDILIKSTFLPEQNWISVLPAELRPLIPAQVAAMSKSEVVAILQQSAALFAGHDTSTGNAAPDSQRAGLSERFPGGIETMLQLFSAHIEITALVNKQYSVTSYATVRYHRIFSPVDTTVIANSNPAVTRMGIYRVFRNNLTSFNPAVNSQPYEEIVLFDAATGIHRFDDTLTIRKNESYFLFVESDPPQPVWSIGGAAMFETHRYEWFYRQDVAGADTVDATDRMSVVNSVDGPVVPLMAATSNAVSRCDIWVQVRDEAVGPRLYPTGSAVFHTKLFFAYTSDYLNK